MGWFSNSEEEEAEIRGATDEELARMTDTQLIMAVLRRHYIGEMDDDALAQELAKRIKVK